MVDDDEPRLSAETLKVLQEFLKEKAELEENDTIGEDWQLSQFWYDENTTNQLTNAVMLLSKNSTTVALISCPTLYSALKHKSEKKDLFLEIRLFEYDRRFSKFGKNFEFYDYNEPLNVNINYKNYFDIVVVDPPFLSKECLTKITQTINFIKKPNSKILLCTGEVMEELAMELLFVKKCAFAPKHKNNLANEFVCLTNFGELPESEQGIYEAN